MKSPMMQTTRYQFVSELGRGGMGVVNLVFDTLLKREVAIKSVLRPQGELLQTWQETVQRLIREAQAAGSLHHPNIVAIYDVLPDDNSPSIVMEFVPGKNASEIGSPGQPIDFQTALRVLKQSADALDHAHARGIVHRDVKPSNIMVDETGSVRLTDFGIAKLLGSTTDLTHGLAVGTLEYMAPEQIEARAVNGRTDQYSLAVVAYRMLTGHKIFDAETMGSWCNMILNQDPIPASRRNPQLPPALDAVLSRAMAKRPELRFSSCGAFMAELELALLGVPHRDAAPDFPARSREPEPPPKSEPQAAKGLPVSAIVVAGSVLGAVVIATLAIHFSAANGSRPPTDTPRKNDSSEAVVRPAKTGPPDSPAALQTWKNPKDGEDYTYIAPATFTIGCVPGDKSCDDDEVPHQVHLDRGFWIGKDEVTAEAFKQFADDTRTPMPPAPEFNTRWNLQNHPIVNVTWPEAKSFCEWAGGRLPTEPEWEYAARGGKEGQKYVSGNTISPADANYNGRDAFDYTAAVGSFPPNGFGLLDVTGNAAEWVDGGEGSQKVVRGGSWNVYPESLRLSKRVLADPDRRNFAFGMRCAM